MLAVHKGVALVTGCAQGIGRAIATRLASDGFHLALTDLPTKREPVEELAHELSKRRSDLRTHVVLGDVSAEETARTSVKDIVENLGGIDVVVTAAGIAPPTLLLDTTEEQWDRVFAVNTKGTFFYYKHVGQQMIKQGRGGRIIGISSIGGKRALPLFVSYSASKYAVRGLTQAAALELGKHGITVNACAPGSIETPMFRDAGIEVEKLAKGGKSGLEHTVNPNASPLGTLGRPEDVAGLVSYLASADSRFMTGMFLDFYMLSKPTNSTPFAVSRSNEGISSALNHRNYQPTATMSAVKGVALVTGCAQGIGRAVAQRLASDGFHIGLCDLRTKREPVEELASELSRRHSNVRTAIALADVRIEDQVRNTINSVVKSLGGIDTLVTCAGIAPVKSLWETTEKEWDDVFAVNTKGTFFFYKYVGQQMILQKRGGRMIGISSMVGKKGMARGGAYSASKFAVRGLTQSAASEFGPRGITVNACAPGIINTPLVRETFDKARLDGTIDALTQAMSAYKPVVDDIGQPEDVAGLVSYLASAESRFVTGQAISIDGGVCFS
ncbi:NAD(P)-binding protein [Coniophora puteana RWD-64-598 SS2]|uniref:NAD(P)-binding protein n=1 Tax=Coniophora puteana (strain RWD-64-598) TaxID=741705 RepID=A0A5M3M8E0_CONPW|nr:NAD(P)-binding protein [Coniophora puteana RWD-64-598 SS2]EIW75532.1 NAD(P)-binding protein [Coniophora puteana RWD-64-598 SS2]